MAHIGGGLIIKLGSFDTVHRSNLTLASNSHYVHRRNPTLGSNSYYVRYVIIRWVPYVSHRWITACMVGEINLKLPTL